MMAPVFHFPENAATKLTATDRFKEAIAKSQAAFYASQEFRKKNPGVVGGSPAQQARVAFLEAINAD